MSTAAITSDAITWTAPNDDHPARAASQRSYSAVAKGDLAEWLTGYAEDAVIEDPVGPSMFDPEGAGHRGHAGISAFWEKAIAPIAKFEFEIYESFANPGSKVVGDGFVASALRHLADVVFAEMQIEVLGEGEHRGVDGAHGFHAQAGEIR